MKESVQERINQIKNAAISPVKRDEAKSAGLYRTNDSLSKSIRNSHEANVFLAELAAAFKIAKDRSNQ